jgi:hypothetical protein
MKNTLLKIILMGLLLLTVVAPFAGLVPLMLFLVTFGVVSLFWSLLRTLLLGDVEQERPQTNVESSKG